MNAVSNFSPEVSIIQQVLLDITGRISKNSVVLWFFLSLRVRGSAATGAFCDVLMPKSRANGPGWPLARILAVSSGRGRSIERVLQMADGLRRGQTPNWHVKQRIFAIFIDRKKIRIRLKKNSFPLAFRKAKKNKS